MDYRNIYLRPIRFFRVLEFFTTENTSRKIFLGTTLANTFEVFLIISIMIFIFSEKYRKASLFSIMASLIMWLIIKINIPKGA